MLQVREDILALLGVERSLGVQRSLGCRVSAKTSSSDGTEPESAWLRRTGAGCPWNPLLARLDWDRARRELGLSPRELDIVREQMIGRSQSEAAADLGMALGTLKTHTRRLYRKLAVSNRTELALSVLCVGLSE